MENYIFDPQEHNDEQERLYINDKERGNYVPIDEAPDTSGDDPYKEVEFSFHKKSPLKQQEIIEEEPELEDEPGLNPQMQQLGQLQQELLDEDKALEEAQEPGYYPEAVPILGENEPEPSVNKVSGKEAMGAQYTNNTDLARMNIPSRWRSGENRGDRDNLKTITDSQLQKLNRGEIKKFVDAMHGNIDKEDLRDYDVQEALENNKDIDEYADEELEN